MLINILLILTYVALFFAINSIARLERKITETNRTLSLICEHLKIEDEYDRQIEETISELINEQRKTEAIKKHRELTSSGLKEAYDYVERLEKRLPK